MVRKTGITLILYLAVMAVMVVWVSRVRMVLYHSAFWWLVAAAAVGLAAGIITGVLKSKKKPAGSVVLRHDIASFLQHWGTGGGIILLIVSGVLIASGRKLWLVFIPEITRSRIMALNLHWLGVFFVLLFGCFFLADFLVAGRAKNLVPGIADIRDGTFKKYLLRQPWQDTGKYKTTQKLAFMAFAVLGAVILVTGAIKTSFFVWPVSVVSASRLHDIASELFVILLVIHVIIVIANPANWALLLSWFTGKEPSKR